MIAAVAADEEEEEEEEDFAIAPQPRSAAPRLASRRAAPPSPTVPNSRQTLPPRNAAC